MVGNNLPFIIVTATGESGGRQITRHESSAIGVPVSVVRLDIPVSVRSVLLASDHFSVLLNHSMSS
jgi:hypothetical protein